MIKGLLFTLLFVVAFQASAYADRCAFPVRNNYGITSSILSESYFMRVHKTLAGELDPYVLGDGGIVVGFPLNDYAPSKKVFVFYENDDAHPFTTKVDNAVYNGWPFLLLKKECTVEVKSKKHIDALRSLVTRHMNIPKTAEISYFFLQ